jgi:thioredoxin 1
LRGIKLSNLFDFTEDNFESEVLASTIPVIVEFGATWCGPCQKQLPILEKLADESGDIKVGKVDVDQSRNLANKYAVRSVPTIMV